MSMKLSNHIHFISAFIAARTHTLNNFANQR